MYAYTAGYTARYTAEQQKGVYLKLNQMFNDKDQISFEHHPVELRLPTVITDEMLQLYTSAQEDGIRIYVMKDILDVIVCCYFLCNGKLMKEMILTLLNKVYSDSKFNYKEAFWMYFKYLDCREYVSTCIIREMVDVNCLIAFVFYPIKTEKYASWLQKDKFEILDEADVYRHMTLGYFNRYILSRKHLATYKAFMCTLIYVLALGEEVDPNLFDLLVEKINSSETKQINSLSDTTSHKRLLQISTQKFIVLMNSKLTDGVKRALARKYFILFLEEERNNLHNSLNKESYSDIFELYIACYSFWSGKCLQFKFTLLSIVEPNKAKFDYLFSMLTDADWNVFKIGSRQGIGSKEATKFHIDNLKMIEQKYPIMATLDPLYALINKNLFLFDYIRDTNTHTKSVWYEFVRELRMLGERTMEEAYFKAKAEYLKLEDKHREKFILIDIWEKLRCELNPNIREIVADMGRLV